MCGRPVGLIPERMRAGLLVVAMSPPNLAAEVLTLKERRTASSRGVTACAVARERRRHHHCEAQALAVARTSSAPDAPLDPDPRAARPSAPTVKISGYSRS